jgi:hypothetical protein
MRASSRQDRIRTEGRMPAFKWANTALGNIKAAITGTYRALAARRDRFRRPLVPSKSGRGRSCEDGRPARETPTLAVQPPHLGRAQPQAGGWWRDRARH